MNLRTKFESSINQFDEEVEKNYDNYDRYTDQKDAKTSLQVDVFNALLAQKLIVILRFSNLKLSLSIIHDCIA